MDVDRTASKVEVLPGASRIFMGKAEPAKARAGSVCHLNAEVRGGVVAVLDDGEQLLRRLPTTFFYSFQKRSITTASHSTRRPLSREQLLARTCEGNLLTQAAIVSRTKEKKKQHHNFALPLLGSLEPRILGQLLIARRRKAEPKS